jgi:hypothetical protein
MLPLLCRGVCANHTDRAWLGERACACGGAGAPCPICNAADEATVPEMPDGFQADTQCALMGKAARTAEPPFFRSVSK